MNKVSLKLKVTVWYTFALLIVSFFILFAMTGVSRNVISKDIEKQTVLSVDSLRDKLTGPNKILSVPNHMLYDKGIYKRRFIIMKKRVLGLLSFMYFFVCFFNFWAICEYYIYCI